MMLPRTTLVLIAALFLIPALLNGSQVAPPGLRDRKQPDSAGAQERNRPAAPRIPGRIVADAWRLGAPESKERVAGLTGVIEINPEDGTWRMIVDRRGQPTLSPDGQSLAFLALGSRGRDTGIWMTSIQGEDPPVRIADLQGIPVWSPDGKQIIVSAPKAASPSRFETWRMDANGANRTKLSVSETDRVLDWSARGQLLVWRTKEGKSCIGMVGLDGTESRPMTISGSCPRFSPDGRRIVYSSRLPQGGRQLTVSDIDGGNGRQINVGENVDARACWSPDARWLAVSLVDLQKTEDGKLRLSADPLLMNCRIEIVSLDGKERRPVHLPPGYVLLGDWR